MRTTEISVSHIIDDELRYIIKWHYIDGLSYKKTAGKIL